MLYFDQILACRLVFFQLAQVLCFFLDWLITDKDWFELKQLSFYVNIIHKWWFFDSYTEMHELKSMRPMINQLQKEFNKSSFSRVKITMITVQLTYCKNCKLFSKNNKIIKHSKIIRDLWYFALGVFFSTGCN